MGTTDQYDHPRGNAQRRQAREMVYTGGSKTLKEDDGAAA